MYFRTNIQEITNLEMKQQNFDWLRTIMLFTYFLLHYGKNHIHNKQT